jgi:hypothetical protein
MKNQDNYFEIGLAIASMYFSVKLKLCKIYHQFISSYYWTIISINQKHLFPTGFLFTFNAAYITFVYFCPDYIVESVYIESGLPFRTIVELRLIRNERICKGESKICSRVSLEAELKILISRDIATQNFLSFKGTPLANDYLMSTNFRSRPISGMFHYCLENFLRRMTLF